MNLYEHWLAKARTWEHNKPTDAIACLDRAFAYTSDANELRNLRIWRKRLVCKAVKAWVAKHGGMR